MRDTRDQKQVATDGTLTVLAITMTLIHSHDERRFGTDEMSCHAGIEDIYRHLLEEEVSICMGATQERRRDGARAGSLQN